MGTNVKSYTDKQLLDRVKSLPSYKGIPKDYWILGVRSNEDEPNVFDDKFYLFEGEKFIMATVGTTNPGSTVLLEFMKYNPKGALVVKDDEWYYEVWGKGFHNGKMKALRQIRPILFYRDNNKNLKAEQIGKIFSGLQGVNFHTATYDANNKEFIRNYIGGWSAGCQVANVAREYYKIIDTIYASKQETVTYCLIKEF